MPVTQPVTTADSTLAAYLQSVELAIVGAYDEVLPLLSEAERTVAALFQSHHREYAAALQEIAGTAAVSVANPRLALVLAARLQTVSDERTALTFAFGVENQLTATYEFALTTVTSAALVQLVSTTIPIVAGHCAVLGSAAALPPSLVFPNGPFEANTVGDGSDLRLGLDPVSFPAD